jgi:hypothetical protein
MAWLHQLHGFEIVLVERLSGGYVLDRGDHASAKFLGLTARQTAK